MDLETKLLDCNFSKKRKDESLFLSWRLGNTWNLNFDFKFQVFRSHQDRKTNLSIWFLGEVTAWQFCFEIYWPLPETHRPQIIKKIARCEFKWMSKKSFKFRHFWRFRQKIRVGCTAGSMGIMKKTFTNSNINSLI